MRWLLLFIFGHVVCVAPSVACSVDASYKIPTNFELVQKSEVIVLARVAAVRQMPTSASDDEFGVTLEPVRFLKGSANSEELRVMGWAAPENWSGISTATTLAQSHFSAGLGACVRQFYQPGELVVAMFATDPGMQEMTGRKLNQVFDPWARVVETVDGTGDIWVAAVERYVTLQSGDSSTLKERVAAEAKRLQTVSTPEAQSIAADLDHYLTRNDPTAVWGNMSTPMSTTAGVLGQKGAGLYCIAGTPPGVMLIDALAERVRLVADDTPHVAVIVASPTPAEKMLLGLPSRGLAGQKQSKAPSLYRFSNPTTLFDELRHTAKDAKIAGDGKPIVSGRPLDALLRWASQCEKLQRVPAPTKSQSGPTIN